MLDNYAKTETQKFWQRKGWNHDVYDMRPVDNSEARQIRASGARPKTSRVFRNRATNDDPYARKTTAARYYPEAKGTTNGTLEEIPAEVPEEPPGFQRNPVNEWD